MPACYTNNLSCYPGERIALHASGKGRCSLEIARVGRAREVVATAAIADIAEHTPGSHPDRDGCGWPVVFEIQTEPGWRSGYYDIALTDDDGQTAHHFFCLKPSRSGLRGNTAYVLATNTYHAYNWCGGANAYADVTRLMSRALTLAEAMENATGALSTQRPFAQLIVSPPADVPRLVNLRKRGFREKPWAGDVKWSRRVRPSPYDNSAGFVNKWEHVFAAWAEEESIALDYFTDYDLDAEPDALSVYRTVVIVGHSEYWSARQRDQVEAFVDNGGRLAIFSGNTCFWKVRWENGGRTLICHKWNGMDAEPNAGEAATHLWSHPAFARPEASITGLSFLFGGYHRLGNCAARGQGGYTVYDDRHWSLEGTDLFYGDTIGAEIPLLGYENDGCRFVFGDNGLPKPVAHLGVPESLEIIALAPCAFGEQPSDHRPLIPPEKLNVCAQILFGDDSEASKARVLRGHAVMASFRRGKGEVFNGGTTEWAHALKARDPFVTQITRNVLRRFGAI
ncbi:MAG: N,N-dimethylformamidase beta subunit family domain-containing protein [Rhizomicrobium sp.]|jgi:hypothetical protein